jgi:hypothetical protein
MRSLVLFVTHMVAVLVGFAGGIYVLPILTAPPAPADAVLDEAAAGARYTATFKRDLAGSDFLHWGEGEISVSSSQIVHRGALAPGPDYMLYLTRQFVEDEAGFEALEERVRIAPIKNFSGFVVDVPEGVNPSDYTTIVIWCESFAEFITAAEYRTD